MAAEDRLGDCHVQFVGEIARENSSEIRGRDSALWPGGPRAVNRPG
jgi:hypothetical protein